MDAMDSANPVEIPNTDLLTGAVYMVSAESGQSLRIDYRIGQLNIGRYDPANDVTPDIDLSVFDAQAHGVSRLHAVLSCTTSSVQLQDLHSVNGTRYNGKLLVPDTNYTLEERGVVQFGTLALQVIVVPLYAHR